MYYNYNLALRVQGGWHLTLDKYLKRTFKYNKTMVRYLFPPLKIETCKFKHIYNTGVKFCGLTALEYWHKNVQS